MQLRDYIVRYAGHDTKSVVLAVADWLEEQARTPDVVHPCDAQRRVVATAFRIAAKELRDQTIECWQ
jgi:hypothetical protein